MYLCSISLCSISNISFRRMEVRTAPYLLVCSAWRLCAALSTASAPCPAHVLELDRCFLSVLGAEGGGGGGGKGVVAWPLLRGAFGDALLTGACATRPPGSS